jgi:WD40 repeat protein
MDQVIVVTGSRDTTLAIWEMVLPQGGWGFNKGIKVLSAEPKMICFGHDEAITCVVVSSSLNLVASGSVDGTIILHDLRDGHIVRVLASISPGCVPSSIALVPKSALVVCAYGVAGALSVHDVNGSTLAKSISRHEAFDAFYVTRDERHILVGNRRGDITVRAVHDLSIRAQINVANVGVSSISTVARDECLLVGLADGRLCLWAPASNNF